MEHKRYKRQEKAKDDKAQMILAPTSKQGYAQRVTAAMSQTLNTDQIVMCPFCLYQTKLVRFLVSTKKGISQGHAQCPDCKNGMMMKNLTAKWTPEQYADFAYPYAASGFWQKVPFATWKRRMKEIGWSNKFWTRYKELRGDDTNESYMEHLDRQQQEEMNAARQSEE